MREKFKEVFNNDKPGITIALCILTIVATLTFGYLGKSFALIALGYLMVIGFVAATIVFFVMGYIVLPMMKKNSKA